MLKKRVEQNKKENQKLKTFQAFDFAEKAEIENLFLDCIEIFKREIFKNEN
jgi:hypothetical protein